ERPVSAIEFRNKIVDVITQTERFDDLPIRLTELKSWNERRDRWVLAERPIRQASSVFRKLFELRGRLERESEKVQLYVGDGILRIADVVGTIDHPLLVQKVELQFDPSIPEFKVVETDDSPELYTSLLRNMPGIDGQLIGRCRDDLVQT